MGSKPGSDLHQTAVHVLLFEKTGDYWQLQDEFTGSEKAGEWMQGSCAKYYDDWMTWKE
jgi:hypothetical protein